MVPRDETVEVPYRTIPELLTVAYMLYHMRIYLWQTTTGDGTIRSRMYLCWHPVSYRSVCSLRLRTLISICPLRRPSLTEVYPVLYVLSCDRILLSMDSRCLMLGRILADYASHESLARFKCCLQTEHDHMNDQAWAIQALENGEASRY